MKKSLLPFLAILLLSQIIHAQILVSVEFLGHKTFQQLSSQYFIFPIKNGVNYYKITYGTPDVQGNQSIASALMAIPDDLTKVYPLLCYQHGTSSSRTDVPSNLNAESALPILFAGLGYLTVTPDYLGLGDSPGFHPYVHAATEASAGADALRAVKEYAFDEYICHDNRVFLTGYSQGGHASAALHRLLAQIDEFSPVAAAHLSGPYSISVVMRELLFSQEPYALPAYLINTMFSYQYVYGNLYNDMSEAVKPPYVDICNQYFNSEISLSQLNASLVTLLNANEGAPIASRIFNDDFRSAIESDPNHPVNLALADNDVHDWIPTIPTRLYYCTADEQVPFENSLVAEAAFISNGSTLVEAVGLGNFNHTGCVTPALFNTVSLFTPIQGTLEPCSLINSVNEQLQPFDIYPNPAGEQFFVKNFPGSGHLNFLDMQGRVVLRKQVGEGDQEIRTEGLVNGLYILDFQTESGNFRSKLCINK